VLDDALADDNGDTRHRAAVWSTHVISNSERGLYGINPHRGTLVGKPAHVSGAKPMRIR
jgi:hypothetical protein